MENQFDIWMGQAELLATVALSGPLPDTYSHTLRVVANFTATQPERLVAFLHDVLEDRADLVSEDMLRDFFPEQIVDALVILTRNDDQTYWDYIHAVAEAPGTAGMLARRVKRADATDNLNRSIGQKSRQARYERVLATVTNEGLAR